MKRLELTQTMLVDPDQQNTGGTVSTEMMDVSVWKILQMCLKMTSEDLLCARCVGRALTWVEQIVQTLGLANVNQNLWSNGDDIDVTVKFPAIVLMCPEWCPLKGNEQDEAFRILKEMLCNALVLALPDGPDDFVVYCDASKQGEASKGILKALTEWLRGLERHFEQRDDGEIYFFDRIWILSVGGVRKLIMDEAHTSRIFSTFPVSPWKGVVRFGKKGKLAPRYVGPFEIVECVGPVAYRLKLPQELSCVHDTFHVSNLKKCLAEPDVQVPLDEIEIDENLRFVEEPIEIVERDVKKLKRRRIPLVKVSWNSRQRVGYTWEHEDQFRKKYPHLFSETVPPSGVAT
ncbi:putative reverse transcriptase domain-containing protein [Tanacetum coccineum]